MVVPWHYHLFNLFPSPPPTLSSVSSPSSSTCGLFIPCRLKRACKSSTDLFSKRQQWAWILQHMAELISSPFLRWLKPSATGNSWDATRLRLHQASKHKLSLTFRCGHNRGSLQLLQDQNILDAVYSWVHGPEAFFLFHRNRGNYFIVTFVRWVSRLNSYVIWGRTLKASQCLAYLMVSSRFCYIYVLNISTHTVLCYSSCSNECFTNCTLSAFFA